MRYPSPRKIRDMQEAVHTTEVDEYTEISDVLYDTLENLTRLHRGEDVLALCHQVLLNEGLVRHNDILVRGVELDDLELHALLEVRVEVPHRADIDLRTWKEGFHTIKQFNDHTTLDAANDRSFENFLVIEGILNPTPAAYGVCLGLGQHKLAMVVLNAFEKDFDFFAGCQFVTELTPGNDAI